MLNPQPEYVELTYAGETVEVTQTATGLYDERQKVDVTLFKAMETDEMCIRDRCSTTVPISKWINTGYCVSSLNHWEKP